MKQRKWTSKGGSEKSYSYEALLVYFRQEDFPLLERWAKYKASKPGVSFAEVMRSQLDQYLKERNY